jgi:peptidoglycan hydrolase FlgJ
MRESRCFELDLATAQRLILTADPKDLSVLHKQSSDPVAAKAVAGQFGALLAQGLMQDSDGSAIPVAGSGVGGNIVSSLFANTISQAAMSSDKLGLADSLFRSIEAKQHPASAVEQESRAVAPPQAQRTQAVRSAAFQPAGGLPLSPYWEGNGSRPLGSGIFRAGMEAPGKAGPVTANRRLSPTYGWPLSSSTATSAATSTAANVDAHTGGEEASTQVQSFVQRVGPLLQEAGRQLGVSPKILLAQAALETGWGRSVVGNNVFGIKAGGSWTGSQVTTTTHEVEAGQMVAREASFRAYPSLDAAVQDYVAMVGGSRRYQAVVGVGNNVAAYAEGLAAGGYATDTEYASKLEAIAASPSVAAVFTAPNQPGPLKPFTAER